MEIYSLDSRFSKTSRNFPSHLKLFFVNGFLASFFMSLIFVRKCCLSNRVGKKEGKISAPKNDGGKWKLQMANENIVGRNS